MPLLFLKSNFHYWVCNNYTVNHKNAKPEVFAPPQKHSRRHPAVRERAPLGQHFLHNARALRAIIESLELRAGETIIEIGPGKGALTLPLAETCEKTGCKIIAVEKDGVLAHELARKLVTACLPARQGNSKLKIVTGDILKILPDIFSNYQLPVTSYKVVGNIPYYITGKLLRSISELHQKPLRTVLTVQREVAERIVAEPPRMNLLAAAVQIWATPKIAMRLHPNDFSPPPQVDSAILLLETKLSSDYQLPIASYYTFIRRLFKQPRKTAFNNLRVGYPKLTTDEVKSALLLHGVNKNERPQDISLAVLTELASYMQNE
jgi:16S rRNA (adenine1518-N6/adenine1519-N6)-dimethyltransferase